MKIKIKKIIASVLTFMMVFTQVPVNVFAADTNISSDGSTYYTSTPGTYNLPGGTYYTKKYSTWTDAGTKFVYNIIALKRDDSFKYIRRCC